MIPFVDLQTQFKGLEKEIRSRVDAVFKHCRFIMGPEIKELEENLAAFTGARHCLTCSSGTDALLLALMALEVGPGDAVLTSPFTFVATAEAVALVGAVPVFVDIDPETFNMDPAELEKAVSAFQKKDSSTYPLPRGSSDLTLKGIITVDLFGLPCDYDPIRALAREHGLFVVEDAAQAFGAKYKKETAPCLGDIGCASFFPAKPLGCYGDGGAVFTEDPDLAEKMVSIRVHGQGRDKYDNARIGLNARMDTLQAAILLPKLAAYPKDIKERQRVADTYARLLESSTLVRTPRVPNGYQSVWAQYSVLSESREEIQSALKEAGVPTAVYYPKPLHLQSAFSSLDYAKGDMPVSEHCAGRIFSLPMHPYLTEETIQKIVGVIIDQGELFEKSSP